ncbi:hypothetical protein ACFOY4_25830 [Actinomadura syzygii]|uniref:Pepco domain-containing protein n=1 Tax=Actinomadura syzygii TaxID=1427538 RepID=A0A5D0UDF6_9ACTN|nr:hypothetical protein [Actinomadura syzygii]TYC16418.1 hypothetical protein FXF65_07355 [Actinomadura syzygii]
MRTTAERRGEAAVVADEKTVEQAGPIPVVVAGAEPVDGEKGLFSAAREAATRVTDVDPARLAANLAAFCASVQAAIDQVPERSGPFRLESFEAVAEITAGGQFRLVGALQGQVKGGVKLVFARPPA